MATFAIDVRGEEAAGRHITEMGERAVDTAPLMNDILDEIIKGEKHLFQSARWKPIAAGTRRERARSGISGMKPLVRTGTLQRLLTSRAGLLSRSRDQLIFGTLSKEYAIATKRGGKRKVVAVPLAQRRAIRELILDHLVGE